MLTQGPALLPVPNCQPSHLSPGIRDLATVNLDSSLADLGLDSLMGVEVRQMLEREHDLVMSMRDIRHLTLQKLQELSLKASTADGVWSQRGKLEKGKGGWAAVAHTPPLGSGVHVPGGAPVPHCAAGSRAAQAPLPPRTCTYGPFLSALGGA